MGVFRFVHFALAVVGQEQYACLLLVAMLSIATYQTGLLVTVLSLPKLVIVLDAITKSTRNQKSISLSLKEKKGRDGKLSQIRSLFGL